MTQWIVLALCGFTWSFFIINDIQYRAYMKHVPSKRITRALSTGLFLLTSVLFSMFVSCRLLSMRIWIALGIITVAHWFIELWRARYPDNDGVFSLTQLMHVIVIGATICIANPGPIRSAGLGRIDFIIYASGFIFLWFGSGIYMRVILNNLFLKTDTEEKLLYERRDLKQINIDIVQESMDAKWRLREQVSLTGSSLIGKLERILIYTFLLAGQPIGISIIIAAKTLLRSQHTKEQTLIEYIIIGTFISLILAFAVLGLTRLAMGQFI